MPNHFMFNKVTTMDAFSEQTEGDEFAETQERIAQRAYQIWEQHGHQPGRELDDWLQAEREIQAEDQEFLRQLPTRPSAAIIQIHEYNQREIQ
jgi:hypothetical protein